MGWNDGEEKDPWHGGKRKKEEDELEESIRRFQQKLRKLFNKGGKHTTVSNKPGGAVAGLFIIGLAIMAVLWLLAGIYIVRPAEQAVVLRFGKFKEEVGSGPHWIPRLVDAAYKVNTQEILSYSYTSDMLTVDENLVTVSVAVQYRRSKPYEYLFNVLNPIRGLEEATASALRQVIGKTPLNDVLTTGRENVRSRIEANLKDLMLKYSNGLDIVKVALQPAKAPEQVKDAFDDAIKAQEDEQRFINQAEAESNRIVQQANGMTTRYLNQANGYKQQVVLNAKADVAGYLAILPQYQRAKVVTRDRLYFDAIQSVLGRSAKLLVDVGGSNSMFYLPLDKLMESNQRQDKRREAEASQAVVIEEVPKSTSNISQSSLNTRPSRAEYSRSRLSEGGAY